LDGKKILDVLEHKNILTGDGSIGRDLNAICPYLNSCIGRPFHILVTKCDCIDPSKYMLVDIRNSLMNHLPFSNIIHSQPKQWPIHLIPVSAVGKGFAKFDEATGTMKKCAMVSDIKPMNVEFSILLALVDQLKLLNHSVDFRYGSMTSNKQFSKFLVIGFKKLTGLAREWSPILELILKLSGNGDISIFELIKKFYEYVANKNNVVNADIEKTKDVGDKNEALLNIIKRQVALYGKLMEHLPESNLQKFG
jgi:hypothetical protein